MYGWDEIENVHSQEQDLKAVNPLYATGDACYQNNCQRCVAAYEARRRGYNVHAKPYMYQVTDFLIYDDEQKGWPSVFENSVLEDCGATDSISVKKNIHTKMQFWKEGSRAIIAVNFLCGGGHVFIAEYKNGKVYYSDPQNAEMDCEQDFDLVNLKTVKILRIDNCRFTERIKECCEGSLP